MLFLKSTIAKANYFFFQVAVEERRNWVYVGCSTEVCSTIQIEKVLFDGHKKLEYSTNST